MISIIRAEASQRLHDRVTHKICITLNGDNYQPEDWSLGGFRIAGYAGGAQEGDKLHGRVTFNFDDIEVGANITAEVKRLSKDNKTLAARFVNLGEREASVFKQYLANRSVPVEGLAVNITSAKDSEKTEPPAKPVGQIRLGSHRLLILCIYLALGGALALALLATLYSHFFRLEVNTAAVSLPIRPIVAADSGVLKEIYVKSGDRVKLRQPLFKIEDIDLTREFEADQLQLARAQAALQTAELKKQKELQRINVYNNIAKDKYISANSSVAALSERSTEAMKELNRLEQLERLDYVTHKDVDDARARFAELDGLLKQARAEQLIATSALSAVKSGSFYDGQRLVGDLPQIDVEIAQAKKNIELATQASNDAQQRIKRLIYLSPFKGVVGTAQKSVRETINKGDAVLVVELAGETPLIEAYVDPDEIGHIDVGSIGTADFPDLNKRYRVKVIYADRTANGIYIDRATYGVQPRNIWQGMGDKSALVRLQIIGLSRQDQQKLHNGMNAVLNLPRNLHLLS